MVPIQPVILAGGTGTRLWPLSRALYPKQLLNLTEDVSLLQATIKRIGALPDMHPPLVVVDEEQRFLTLNQIEELGLKDTITIILEPLERDTAPAICSAVFYARTIHGEDTVMLVLPADHLIYNQKAFIAGIAQAQGLALAGSLVTFGITPRTPETGYGYIEKGDGNTVLSFVEKPDRKTAERYLAAGNYFWNSGMLAFTIRTFLAEAGEHAPRTCAAMEQSVARGRRDHSFFHLQRSAMKSCTSESIDYALLEKSRRVAVVPVDMDWHDIGSWQTLWEVSTKDKEGNVVHGDVLLEDVHNSLIRSEYRLVAGVGLADILVVETGDAVLVAPRARAQDVKKIVTRIKADNKEEYRLHRTVYRPWGSYTVLEKQPRYKIKRVTVKPGAKLSLQRHRHRSEHWVVVSGTAKVTCGDKVFLVHENESTFIPAGQKHRLENEGSTPLEIIEVQNGIYLGKDDIVRYEDI